MGLKKMDLREQLNIEFNRDRLISVFNGERLELKFYERKDSDFLGKQKLMETAVVIKDSTAHIIISEDLFDSTLNGNIEALSEYENLLVDSNSKLRVLLLPFTFLPILWFTWYIVYLTYPEFLYGLPFWLQVIGALFLTLFYFGPITYAVIIKYKSNRYHSPKRNMLNKVIRNKEFRRTYKLFKKGQKRSFKDKEINIYILPILRKTITKVIMGYSLLIILFAFLSMPIIMFGGNISDLPIYIKGSFEQTTPNPGFINTKYEYIETIDNPTSSMLFSCGDYLCGSSSGFYTTIYDYQYNELDLSGYCDDLEYCSLSVYDQFIHILLRDSERLGYKNLVIDYSSGTVMYEFVIDDIGDDTWEYLAIFDLAYDANTSTMYFVGKLNTIDDNFSVIFSIDEFDNVNIQTNEGLFANNIVIDDYIYFVTDNGEFDILYQYTLDLELVNQIEVQNRSLSEPYFTMFDNDLYIKTETSFFVYRTYKVNDELELEEVLKTIEINNDVHFYDDYLLVSGRMSNFKEYDSTFKVVNKGLICDDCSESDYYGYRSYVKRDGYLYSFGLDNIIIFEEMDSNQRTISPPVLIPALEWGIIGIALVINVISILWIVREKKHIQAIKTIS